MKSDVTEKSKKEFGDIGCTVPLHKELAIGILKGILKQANISIDNFLKKV
ncbi:MAG: type II toxin-antitoxin system HicA family toxin [Ignavibacteria bacterium]|nr:type II toxin-antitoxin system HicA family toxin [Ignavibacteria bacterium]